ncbi:MAG: hypothetical protein Q8P59_00165 [Dehalococcoidia bacterium]|nr:hypothetical protein [Dehalococcoidia bacterium]
MNHGRGRRAWQLLPLSFKTPSEQEYIEFLNSGEARKYGGRLTPILSLVKPRWLIVQSARRETRE